MTAKPKQPRKPAIVRPCGPDSGGVVLTEADGRRVRIWFESSGEMQVFEMDDDREEKNRQLARLGAAMPRLVNR